MHQALEDFLKKLFQIFPPECAKNKEFELLELYFDTVKEELVKDRKYDFDKLLRLVFKDHKYKNTPPVKMILERLPQCEITSPVENVNMGGLVRITCENGFFVDLTATTNTGNLRNDVMRIITQTYGKIKKIEKFAKGTVIIGKTIFLPDGTTYKWQPN